MWFRLWLQSKYFFTVFFTLFCYWLQRQARISSPLRDIPYSSALSGPSWSLVISMSSGLVGSYCCRTIRCSWISTVLHFSASSVLIHVETYYVCEDTRKNHIWKLLFSGDSQHKEGQTDEIWQLSIMCMFIVDQLQPA